MAILQGSEDRVVLLPRHHIGRSRRSDLCVPARDVSGEHAVFLWTGQDWELRDLGSRNGTWLEGRQLQPGERATVRAGDRVAFGNPGATWVLASEAAPGAAAIGANAVVEAVDEFLALPSLDDPQVIVERDPEQGWRLIRDGDAVPAEDGAEITLATGTWRLTIPSEVAPVPMTAEMRDISQIMNAISTRGIEIAVSADQEYIEVTVVLGGERHQLPPRVHHELLLALARQRLADRDTGVAASEEGWVYTSDLRKMLAVSANQFYVMSHRCKRELETLGLDGVLEKRRTSHQVRLGLRDLAVRSL